MHDVIGWKYVLYQTIEHRARAELKLSHHLPNITMSDHLLDFSFFFFVNWKWNFGTGEWNKGLQTCQAL